MKRKEKTINLNINIQPQSPTKVITLKNRYPIFKIALNFWWLIMFSPLWWVRFLQYRRAIKQRWKQYNEEFMINAKQIDVPTFFKTYLHIAKNRLGKNLRRI